MWGETWCSLLIFLQYAYFNPVTPCGVRPCHQRLTLQKIKFQSTHPRVGWDLDTLGRLAALGYFNPPTPCGVRQWAGVRCPVRVLISIHSPRVGWDVGFEKFIGHLVISIHSPPCGVRHSWHLWWLPANHIFNPLTPVWGETDYGSWPSWARESGLNKKPPAMRVESKCYTKNTPFSIM